MCGIFFLDESGFRANKKYSILLGWGGGSFRQEGAWHEEFFFSFSHDLFFSLGESSFFLYFPPLSLLRPSLGR